MAPGTHHDGAMSRPDATASPGARALPPDFLIWAPPFTHRSSGVRALYRLCHHLNTRGHPSAMVGPPGDTHPAWLCPRHEGEVGDSVVVYPEIVPGNPLGAKTVVRWCLNNPGLLGGDTAYADEEIVFVYDPQRLEEINRTAVSKPLGPKRILWTGLVDPGVIHPDPSVPKTIDCVFTYKGRALRERFPWPDASTPDLEDLTPDFQALGDTLRRTRTLYSYDHYSNVLREAAICGCEVRVIGEDGVWHDPRTCGCARNVIWHPDLLSVYADHFNDSGFVEGFVREVCRARQASPAACDGATTGHLSLADTTASGPSVRITAESVPQQALADLVEGAGRCALWSHLAFHDIRQRFRRSVLGPFWLTLSMGVMIGALGLVFSTLFQQNISETLPYIATGIIFWGLMTSCINEGTMTFIAVESLVRNIPLPVSVHFYRMMARNVFVWLFNMAIYLGVVAIFPVSLGWSMLLFLPGFALFLVNAAWIALASAILSTRYRDIPQVIGNIVQVMFFLTPIFWSPEVLPNRPAFVELNPFYHLIALVRDPLLGHAPKGVSWLFCLGLSGFGLALTAWLYRRAHARIAYWL
jgi:ABC-type polysaccharide/polyol phosphate export permease